jgi:probable F420-dependent oxidoreductase
VLLDVQLDARPDQAAARARELADAGVDGLFTFEGPHDVFLPLVAAAGAVETDLMTNVAIALPRSPMHLAHAAYDLQLLSKGRFRLGLGSQIKPHIERRYSMPWSKPAARMREFVLAIRAIWECWESGGELDFEGEFYTHTLMPPFFNPGPNPHGKPKIMLAAVGPLMTEAAGEVGDGMLCHAFSTERYLREATLPALERGFEKAGRTREGFEITAPSFVVARDSKEELAEGVEFVKQQIAFYGSTPAYRPVLELHGWGELQEELLAMTKRGEWDRMSELIDDELVETFAVVGTPEEAFAEVRRRYGDIATRVTLTIPEERDEERWRGLFESLRA